VRRRSSITIAERQRVFESFGAFEHTPVNLSLAGGDPERFEAVALGAGALQATRVRPVWGRVSWLRSVSLAWIPSRHSGKSESPVLEALPRPL
jgi:hypothetical protein